MLCIGLHGCLTDLPGGVMAPRRFLEHAIGRANVWFARSLRSMSAKERSGALAAHPARAGACRQIERVCEVRLKDLLP